MQTWHVGPARDKFSLPLQTVFLYELSTIDYNWAKIQNGHSLVNLMQCVLIKSRQPWTVSINYAKKLIIFNLYKHSRSKLV